MAEYKYQLGGVSASAWWTALVGDGTETDPNGLKQAAITQDGTGALTYQVSGGAGYTNPRDGLALSWPLQDIFGSNLTSFPMQLHIGIEIVTPPTASSTVTIAAGVISGPDIATDILIWTGIDYDGVNPRGKSGEAGSVSNGPASASIVAGVADFEILPSATVALQRWVGALRTGTLDSTDTRVNAVSRAVNNEQPNVPRFFLSVYGSGAIVGTETVVVRPRVVATPFPGSWT